MVFGLRSIRTKIARGLLKIAWTLAIQKGPAEPIVSIDGRKIEWEIDEPFKVQKSGSRHWDPSIYQQGNVYLADWANPIAVLEDKVEEYDDDGNEIERTTYKLEPSEKYSTFLDQVAIQHMFSTNLRKIAIAILVGLGVVGMMVGALFLLVIQNGA